MRFMIFMLILMVLGGAIGAYVDDQLLRLVLVGLFIFCATYLYVNKRKSDS